jgi:hypothetical protein|tara:strand:- start:1900 stop:2112 length:213 start_codon:yes stop_codon:yes gene_type:complete
MIILITLDSGNTLEISDLKDLPSFLGGLKELLANSKVVRFTSSDDEVYRFLQDYLEGVTNLEINGESNGL